MATGTNTDAADDGDADDKPPGGDGESGDDSAFDAVGAFGQVSRTKGVVFSYLLLAATLVGIVSLAVLLGYVVVDAFEPATAETAWFVVWGAALVLPLALLSLYFRRHPAARQVGVTSVTLVVAGALAAATLLVVFTVTPYLVWFAWAVGVAVPAALFAGYRRLRADGGTLERLAVAVALFALSLVGVPPVVPSVPWFVQFRVPIVPIEYVAHVLTVGLPVAVLTAAVVARHEESRRAGLLAGALVVAGSLSVMFQVVVHPSVALVLVLGVVVPAGYHAASTLWHRRDGRSGLLLPVVLVGGVALSALTADVLGVAGPESWVDWQFLTSLPSGTPEIAGIYPALVGSVLLMVLVVLLSFPVGVGAAVYLEEYAPNSRTTRFIQVNISNLAGVPSVVYGLLGLGLFINAFDLTSGSLVVGGMTLSLLILPIVVIAAQEAIRSVPGDLRDASYGMGATRWQTIRNVVLPEAMPGILTGTILAIGRAIGETAPLLIIAAPATTFGIPRGLLAKTSAMPLQIFDWAFLPQEAFRHGVTAAGVVTLLTVLLAINSIAILVRNRYQRPT